MIRIDIKIGIGKTMALNDAEADFVVLPRGFLETAWTCCAEDKLNHGYM